MIFRQLIDPESKTMTYVIGDPWSRDAVIIDPVRELIARDLQTLDELGLKLVYAIDTHVHADHVTGAGALRARTGCKVSLHFNFHARASGATAYLSCSVLPTEDLCSGCA